MTIAYEYNFDGLSGITHVFGGLSYGNLPSMENEGQPSNPRLAALEGLNKMKMLASLGIKQAVLPPQERPHIPTLKALGYEGSAEAILEMVQKNEPWLIKKVSSAASMWTANAATVSPSIDSIDTHLHFTVANLATNFHRSIEAETTQRILKSIFNNPIFFEHHNPLPEAEIFLDEGAANHSRFCKTYQGPGVQLFVYGKSLDNTLQRPIKFPARQTQEASNAIIRLHKLYPRHFLLARQNSESIDAGVFHNDVISVANQNVFLLHEKAFFDQERLLKNLEERLSAVSDTNLIVIEVKESELPIKEAVQSYFFNSQLVTLPDGSMALIVPSRAKSFESVGNVIKKITEDPNNPISQVHFVDLSESLKNGGGPACLRLRVVLNENEVARMNQGVLFNERLYSRLVDHVNEYYPTSLSENDLADPELYKLSCESLEKLTQILNLGKIYSFQFS